MKTWSEFFVISLFISSSLLLAGCSQNADKKVESDMNIVGTWLKMGDRDQMMTLTLKSDQTYEVDFSGGSTRSVNGTYFAKAGQVSFIDKGNERACSGMEGIYYYSVDESQLIFSVMEDECQDRIGPTSGAWVKKGTLEACNKAIELTPDDAISYTKRGMVRTLFHDHQGALDDYDKAIALAPDLADAYVGRGVINAAFLENYEEALLDLNKAIELDPEHQRAYFNRGLIRLKQYDIEGACEDWIKSFDLGFIHVERLVEKYCQ